MSQRFAVGLTPLREMKPRDLRVLAGGSRRCSLERLDRLALGAERVDTPDQPVLELMAPYARGVRQAAARAHHAQATNDQDPAWRDLERALQRRLELLSIALPEGEERPRPGMAHVHPPIRCGMPLEGRVEAPNHSFNIARGPARKEPRDDSQIVASHASDTTSQRRRLQ